MEEQKINVCRTLASLFGDDPSDEETAFVGRCALDLGLDESALKLVLQSIGTAVDTEAVLGTVQEPMLRRFLFRRLVAAVLIDDQLTAQEKAVIERVVARYGWDKSVADAYVGHMKRLIAMERESEQLIAKLG
jgi:hypothetical protein